MVRVWMVVVLLSLIVVSYVTVFVIEGLRSGTNNFETMLNKYTSITYTARAVELGEDYIEPVPPRTTSPEKIALDHWMEMTGVRGGPLFKATFIKTLGNGEHEHFNVFSSGLEIRLEKVDAGTPMLFNISVVFMNAVIIYPSKTQLIEDYLTSELGVPVSDLSTTSKDGRFKLAVVKEFVLPKTIAIDPREGQLTVRKAGETTVVEKGRWLGFWPYTLPAPGEVVVAYAVKPSLFDKEGFVGLANVVLVKEGLGRPVFSIFNPVRDQDVPRAISLFQEMYGGLALEPDRFEPAIVTNGGRYMVYPFDVYEYRYNSEGLLIAAYPTLVNKVQHGMKIGQEVSNLLIPTVVLDDFYFAVITPFSKTALLALELKEAR